MAVFSPVFLLLLVAFLEFGKAIEVDCTENGGVCIPFYPGVKCITTGGQCPIGAICCKACNTVPNLSCIGSNGYCVKKRRDCKTGKIGCKAKGCKCCLTEPATCQPFTEILGFSGEVVVPENGLTTYQDNLYCEWIIEVPYGYWISINFLTFDLEGNTPYCPWDYVEFSDASSFPQWQSQKFCGNYDPWRPAFEASTNRIRVVFLTDVTVVKSGFSFAWNATDIPSCQPYTALYGDYGEVRVPENGGPTYQINRYCEWFIEVPYGFWIAISISSFDLEGPFPECPWDYLQFFSASPDIQWQSEKLCGNIYDIPIYFKAPTSSILAVFNSDIIIVGGGFSFIWSAVVPDMVPSCQPYTNLYGEYGEVRVPENGGPTYQINQYCEWFIEVPYGFWIEIKILSLDLEGPFPECPWDYLQFFSALPDIQWQSEKLCGSFSELLPYFMAPTSSILAVFNSDIIIVGGGFNFSWSAVDPDMVPSCQPYTPLYGEYGEVRVPEYGGPTYQINQYCEWFIEVPYGFWIAIEIFSLDLEGPFPECPWDYLQFFSASPDIQWQSEKLCGNIYEIHPSYFVAPTSSILAVFNSDIMIVGGGFSFSWSIIGSTTGPPISTLINLEYAGGEILLHKKGVKVLPEEDALKDEMTN